VQIVLAYNDGGGLAAGEADDALGVEAVLDQVEAIEQACLELGWTPRRVAVGRDLAAAVEQLRQPRPDVVFMMVECVGGDSRLEAATASVFEWLGLPYTGPPPLATAIALHKPAARAVLAAAGVRVPRGVVLETGEEPLGGLPFPVIVKPSREDGSHGIRNESFAAAEQAARERARYIIEHYAQPALVEEFVAGREFNVSLLGPPEDPRVLPLREIHYTLPRELPRLVGYEAKWKPGTVEYRGTPSVPVDHPPETVEAVGSIARAAYTAVGLRDYGRVDVRLDARDRPVVIDVNANPDLTPSGNLGLPGTALEAGLSYPDLIRFIVEQALARRPY
jgi:D-alanine-D-alanine ligase